MGLTAVVTIMLRFCTRPVQDYNQNATTIIPRGGIRVSLTSLQQRVMRKLRDRPPRYETRHNYEYNQRENPIAVITMVPKSSNEPPPPYDNELVTVSNFHHFPTISLQLNDYYNIFVDKRTAAIIYYE